MGEPRTDKFARQETGASLDVTRDAAGDLHDFVTGCFIVFESVRVFQCLMLLGIACVRSFKIQQLRRAWEQFGWKQI